MSRASAVQNLVSFRDNQSTAPPISRDDHPSPMTLVCAACRKGPFSYEGFRRAVSESRRYDATTGCRYQTTWSEISQSISNEACNWCCIIKRTRDGLPASKFSQAGEDFVEVTFKVLSGNRKSITIYLNGHNAASYTIYAYPDDSAAGEIGTEVDLLPKTQYVTYSEAMECIRRCDDDDHEHCPAIEETYLPTRVLDCSDPYKPRLVETQRQIRGHYCALSYVWGGNQHQKLTTFNIDTYLRDGLNIPLPQTIADAILTTNKLGVRYLWVDALCIIQDSSEDKDMELRAMTDIFSNAYVTLSILSAFRADEGFLPDEREHDVLPFLRADRRMPLGRMLLKYDMPRRKLEPNTVPPLDERGWCLQESLLSPRRLIFDPPYLSYKCRSFATHAIGQSSPDHHLSLGLHYTFFPSGKNRGSMSTVGEVDASELHQEWQYILADYSMRKITVPSDKFAALASLAEKFQSISKDEYIAGLWRRTLLHDLLWRVWPPTGPHEVYLPRPGCYRAPTGSWASVDGPLDLSNDTYSGTYKAAILACEATPKTKALPFGEITNARLTMRVKTCPVIRDRENRPFFELLDKSTNRPLWQLQGISFDCLEGTQIQDDSLRK